MQQIRDRPILGIGQARETAMPAPVRLGAINYRPNISRGHVGPVRNRRHSPPSSQQRHDRSVTVNSSSAGLSSDAGKHGSGVVIGNVWHAPNITVSGWLVSGRRRGTHHAADQTLDDPNLPA